MSAMSKRHGESSSDQVPSPGSKRRRIEFESGHIRTSKKTRTADDYTVGWICPLEVEQIAALEMLDEEHERLPQAPADHNVYNLGSIAGHNIVIAGQHQAGNSPAATVVTQMRMTFRNLRFGLLVGIGGGVPVKTDNGMIRLGDIVVSKPTDGHSGVVQYDHGKAISGTFERTGVLTPPPAVLLNAAQDLAAKRARSRKDPVEENVKRIDTSIRGLRKYKRPEKDYLYEANYIHIKPELSCDQCECDPSKRIQRPAYDDDDDDGDDNGSYIIVHRGTIASGETVVKDAILRDELAEKYGFLCFEMEAAGALADFPCLVIRGISDYCDSHKNNQWHGYAAAAAAAYSRQLFFHMPIDEVKRYISETTEETLRGMNLRQEDQDRQRVLEWLSPTNFPAQQHDFISRRQDGTAQWFLDSMAFQEWLQGSDKTLFCPGIPGAGKTMMAAVTIDFLYQSTQIDKTGIAFLFCSYKSQADQSTVNLLAAILKQLLHTQRDITDPVASLHEEHSKRNTKPGLEDLMKSLLSTCSIYSTVYIVVDALDECTNTVQRQLRDKLFSLQATMNVRLLFTSRFIPEVTGGFLSCPWLEVRASNEDVSRYVAGQLWRLPGCIQRDESLKAVVQTKIVEAADSMFLLARLHVDSLQDKRNKHQVLSTLDQLSKGSTALKVAYSEAIKRIDGQLSGDKLLARRTICWISYAQRPLTTKELCCALAIETGDSALNTNNIYEVDDIVSVCAGLVTVDEQSGIIRLVHHTTQEYFEQVRGEWSPTAPEELAITCLTYLLFDTFRDGIGDNYENLDRTVVENQFFDYSARHWSDHVRPVQQSASVSELALDLLHSDDLLDSIILVLSKFYGADGLFVSSLKGLQGLHFTAKYGLLYLTQKLITEPSNREVDPEDEYCRRPLSYAAEGGHKPVVKLLLDAGADVHAEGGYEGSALHVASTHGHEQVVKLLVDTGADVNSQGGFRHTSALQLASNGGHDRVVNLLLGAGADVNAQDKEYNSALREASAYGHEQVVKLLLDAGADVNAGSGEHGSALCAASAHGYERVVQLLLDEDADVSFQGGRHDNALQAASYGGHGRIVKLLLDAEADVNKGYEGHELKRSNALYQASACGHVQVVKLLLDAGTDVNWEGGGYDSSALNIASSHGHKQIVKLLLDAGANVNWQSRDFGGGALYAASEDGHEQVVKLLLDAGADVNMKGRRYSSALCAASASGHQQVVKLLLNAGADVNAGCGEYGRPLYVATKRDQNQFVDLVRDAAAKISAPDPFEKSNSLSGALDGRYEEITKLLLGTGSSTNAQGKPNDSALDMASSNGHEQLLDLMLNTQRASDHGNALYLASHHGHERVVKLLLGAGADINARSGFRGNALLVASGGGHEAVVKLLLDGGVDVNAQDEGYTSALQMASADGHERIVKLLLDAGADVNAQNDAHRSALQMASANGHERIVRLLLDAGANVNAQDEAYSGALQKASRRGHERVVKLLLDAGADVNARGGEYSTALFIASSCGHDQVVKILLDAGADVTTHDAEYSVLYIASAHDHQQVVKLLLDAGADVNEGGKFKHGSALYAASGRGYRQVVMLLLDNGADVNAQGGNYGNALQAASHTGHEQVVKLLLNKGADINAEGGFYGSALIAASAGNHEQVVKLLVEAGADVNLQDEDHGSALQKASARGHERVVKLLLDAGADLNEGGEFEQGNALYTASANGHDHVVKLLLEGDADANVQGGPYGSALHAASYNGHEQVVKLLLSGGADVNIQGGLSSILPRAVLKLGQEQVLNLLLDTEAHSSLQDSYDGRTPNTTSVGDQEQVVKLLLDACANVDAQSNLHYSALDAASDNGHTEVEKLLLDVSADINAQSGLYSGALYEASARGHGRVVKLLLDAGADARGQRRLHPWTPLCAASEGGHEEVVKLLLDGGAV